MKKIISAKEAINMIKDGSSVMVGGFISCGAPDVLVDELVEQNVKELTLICNDTSVPGKDKGRLIENKQVKKLFAAHIGLNPETGRQMQAGELDVELIPMGSLIERIRAKGAGLGGILTPTGVGTIIEDNNEISDRLKDFDLDYNRLKKEIIDNVKRNGKPGSIILFHDYISGESHTLEALEELLPYLSDLGYSFKTISEIKNQKQP